jgi:hypothetical protein
MKHEVNVEVQNYFSCLYNYMLLIVITWKMRRVKMQHVGRVTMYVQNLGWKI